MKTAVEKLIEQLTSIGALEITQGSNVVTSIINEAKEIEKEQQIEFAKLHVEAALKAVEDKIIVRGYAGSIMNSYPLENIK